jgi:hypothetical protein
MKSLLFLSVVLCAAQGEAPIATTGGTDGPPEASADLKVKADAKPADEAKALVAAFKGKSYDQAAAHHTQLLAEGKHEDAAQFHAAVITDWKGK